MAMNVYQTGLDWVPDSSLINAAVGLEYIAWQIGRSENLALALWLIAPVVESPTDLTSLLPISYEVLPFLDDVQRTGFQRSVLNKSSIDDVQARFLAEVVTVTAAVADGSRA